MTQRAIGYGFSDSLQMVFNLLGRKAKNVWEYTDLFGTKESFAEQVGKILGAVGLSKTDVSAGLNCTDIISSEEKFCRYEIGESGFSWSPTDEAVTASVNVTACRGMEESFNETLSLFRESVESCAKENRDGSRALIIFLICFVVFTVGACCYICPKGSFAGSRDHGIFEHSGRATVTPAAQYDAACDTGSEREAGGYQQAGAS